MIGFISKKILGARVRLFVTLGRLLPWLTRRINIGNTNLVVPINHLLDIYKSENKFYDHFFPILCYEVCKENSEAKIIDIGANVGDTAALVRAAGVDAEMVTIEASTYFFSLLKRNIEASPGYYGRIRMVHAFVGDPNTSLKLTYTSGTAGASESTTEETSEAIVIGLGQIDNGNVALIKIDTDGYDGSILLSGLDYVKDKKPILWAETLIPDAAVFKTWSDFLHGIVGFYEGYYLFDNTGRPVLTGILDQNSVVLLLQILHTGLIQRSLQSVNIGTVSTPYYDLALFPTVASPVWGAFGNRVAQEINAACGLNLISGSGK